MRKIWTALRLLYSNPSRFVNRLQSEFSSHSTRPARGLGRLYAMLVPNTSALSSTNDERLLFVYDTALNPVTFDFLHHLYYLKDGLKNPLARVLPGH